LHRQLIIQLLVLTVIVLFLNGDSCGVSNQRPVSDQKADRASQDVGRGQYTLVEVKSADELGLLAQAFNSMMKRLSASRRTCIARPISTSDRPSNRMMALDRISQEINRAKRSLRRFAMFFIDLDNFKYVNDSLGND
jgi:predicted signal transduction protein with EAL and GGDEF domain